MAFACAAIAIPASAVLYKWTDANGRVVYSDLPPPGDIKAEIVQGSAPPANPNAARELAVKELELKKRQTEAAEKEKKVESAQVEFAKKSVQCARMQSQIRQLSSEQIGLTRVNEKGETVFVDAATRRKERADIEEWVRTNCS